MNKPIDLYIERTGTFINSEQFSELSTLPRYKFKDLVVIGQNGRGRPAWLDFGSLCYKTKTIANGTTHTCKVVLSSFTKTLEPVFNTFTRSKLSKCSPSSAHSYHTQLKDFAAYYFENLEDLEFNDYEQCCKEYERYTQELLIKKSQILASENKKGLTTLAKRQTVFAELICLHHNKELQTFKSAFIGMKTTPDFNGVKPIDMIDLSYFYEVNKRIFYALKDFLMEEKDFPFIFEDSFIGEKFYHYPREGFYQTLAKYIFRENGSVVSEAEIESTIAQINRPFGKMSVEGYKSYIKNIYDGLGNYFASHNYLKSREKAKLINYAVSAFAMCFYCESSINPAQLYTMEIKDLSEYKDSIKGYKLVTMKPRAGCKNIAFIISVKMLPLLNSYKEFRKWCLELSNNNDIPNILFYLDTKLGSTDDPFEYFTKYTGSTTKNYRGFLKLYLPQFKWNLAAVIRKTGGNFVFTETKSTAAAAQKLGNTPSVFNRVYSDATDKDLNEQVTDFFTNIHDQITNKYRKGEDPIHVHINIESKETAIGSCKKTAPKLNSGFTDDLEKPNCSNPSSCLFCENYVVHSDEEDIRKLMSLKKILTMSDKTDEALIITNRINEISRTLLDKYPETENIFIDVAESANNGQFDEYWRDHLNLLLELGVNFYE